MKLSIYVIVLIITIQNSMKISLILKLYLIYMVYFVHIATNIGKKIVVLL